MIDHCPLCHDIEEYIMIKHYPEPYPDGGYDVFVFKCNNKKCSLQDWSIRQ